MEGIAVLFSVVVAVLSLIALLFSWVVIRLLHSRNENLHAIIESQNEAIDSLMDSITKNW